MKANFADDKLELIARNLAGISDSQENLQLNTWIESSPENKQYFEEFKNIWDNSDKSIPFDNIDSERALKNVLKRSKIITPQKSFWYFWQKIAAILIIPLLLGTLLWIPNGSKNKSSSANETVYNEVHVALGTRSSLRLDDSTLVWLNSGSLIKYPVKFDEKNRKVFLDGEAYFEVKSDVKRPFIVETPTLIVQATGTKFNVSDLNSEDETKVSLVSGRVIVKESNPDSDYRLISELKPNQHLSYNRNTKITHIVNEDVYKYIAWKDGKLIFRNEPLNEVLNKLSLLFNVDIELQGDELMSYRYHATFQDESFEEILKLLKISAPINYTEIKRDTLPDGSFSKKKVVVFQNKATKHN